MPDASPNARMTRRTLVRGFIALGVAGASALLASCAPAAPAAPPASATAPAAAAATQPAQSAAAGTTAPALATTGGAIELKLLTSNGASHLALARPIALLAKRTNGQITVTQDVVPFDALLDKEISQFISKAPTYDILAFTSGQLGAVWQYLSPLDDRIKAGNIDLPGLLGPKAPKSVTFETGIIGLPYSFAAPIFYYRKDSLDAAGLSVPKSREEYRAAAAKLARKSADVNTQVYGTSFYAKVPQWTLESFSNFFFRGGGRFLTDDLKSVHPVLREAYTADTIDYMKAIVDDGVTPDPVGWTADDNVVSFQQQKLAMSFLANSYAATIEDPAKSQVSGKMAYSGALFDKPQGPEPATTFGNTWNLAIDKNSAKQDAAWQFVSLCTTDLEAVRDLAVNANNATAVLRLLDDPEVIKNVPASIAVKEILAGPGWIDFFPVPQYAEFVKIIHEEIQAVYLGRQKGAQAAQNLYKRFDDTLKRG